MMMNKGVARTLMACLAFVALVLGLTVNKVLSPGTVSNEALSEMGLFVYDTPRELEEFSLTDHEQGQFSKADLQGQWTLIFFGYTYCPDICPLTMASLGQFSRMLEEEHGEYTDDTQVVMVSVDPERDTPEKLADYVSFFNDDYIGATGEYIDIFNFASQLNVAFNYTPADDGDYLVSHSGEIALINPNGHFHGFFRTPPEPDSMIEAYSAIRERW